MNRIYDEILRRETSLHITGIDDLDLIVIPQRQVNQLIEEFKAEHEMEDHELSDENLEDYIGSKIIVVDDRYISDFKFYKEVK